MLDAKQITNAIKVMQVNYLPVVLNAIVKECICRKVFKDKRVSDVVAEIEKTWQGLRNENSSGVQS